ncbi:MAG: dihydropteroate synthase-like enzyme [Actinomycetia bacterium]|nr:dihydropteroate synthase-like enzyme [Actinomycetes bacterium]
MTEANGSTTLHAAGRTLEFDGHSTHVMAVLNLSPESRVRHSVVGSPEEALERARAYRSFGASIVDLGAQSSHFENRELSADEEIGRMLPALRLLVDDGFVVSVDTWKPAVARAALEAGAGIVNDTGGLQDPEMVEVVAGAGAPAVVMYIEGRNPLAVGDLEFSADKPQEVAERFAARIDALAGRGIRELILDPGLSINYRSDYEEYGRQQLRVIRGLGALRALGHPVLVPVPRKADTNRMLAYLTLSLEYGADLIRVHDVEAACDLVALFGRTAAPPA